MQVILSDREFKQAMSCWLTAQGFDVSKYLIDVKITVGRGENAGTKAEITLTDVAHIDQCEESVGSTEDGADQPIDVDVDEEPTGNARPLPFFNSGE